MDYKSGANNSHASNFWTKFLEPNKKIWWAKSLNLVIFLWAKSLKQKKKKN